MSADFLLMDLNFPTDNYFSVDLDPPGDDFLGFVVDHELTLPINDANITLCTDGGLYNTVCPADIFQAVDNNTAPLVLPSDESRPSQPASIDAASTSLPLQNAVPAAGVVNIEPVACKPAVQAPYATKKDWAAARLAIANLYRDQNLNLQDVMQIMESRHQFRATTKMYKNQFAKWNWHKYKSGKHSRDANGHSSKQKSCLRHPAMRIKAIHHESTGTALVGKALHALQETFEASIASDPSRQTNSRWEIQLPTQFVSHDILSAQRYFETDQPKLGGIFLRRAFLMTEDLLQDPGTYDIKELALHTVDTLLDFKRDDILLIYISFLKQRLTLNHGSSLQRIVNALYDLTIFDVSHLSHYILKAAELFADTVGRRNRGHDINAIRAKDDALCKQWYYVDEFDPCWDMGRIVGQYEQLIRDAEDQNNKDAVLELQDEVLHLQYRMSIYSENFVSLSKTQLRTLQEDSGDWNPGGGSWDIFHDLYANRLNGLISYFLDMGNNEEAAKLLPETLDFIKSELVEGISKISVFQFLERKVRECGMISEADAISRALQSSRAVASAQQLIEGMDKLEIQGDLESAGM